MAMYKHTRVCEGDFFHSDENKLLNQNENKLFLNH